MSKILTAAEIRQGYLDFFKAKGHEIVPSSPVVVTDDPTLMFNNAGMNQFKDVFLGTGSRPYSRATDSQKCMRVSGKHNDLEDVGKDHSHHTLFEMLGNWSFGDYYKKEAIAWAWELLTQVWGLDPKRIHATVFTDDDESYELWKEFVVDESYISRHGHKDNFWEMGDTGPCGPCTELHYDLGEEFTSIEDSRPNYDDERFREIWNLVFIQYDRQKDGSLQPLPSTHVDTGMGFERVVSVMQGTHSTYETDIFKGYIEWLVEKSGVAYSMDEAGMPHRVIADHLRAVAFTVADGVIPANDGAGYVVRRILRRAARYGKKIGLDKPFMFEMVPLLIENLGAAYPELVARKEHIVAVIQDEEERFSVALDKGEKLFAQEAEKLAASGKTVVPGETVFYLFGTHGFPMDLTRLMAEERGLTIDEPGFEAAREKDKEETRAASKQFKADDSVRRCAEGIAATVFTGYDTLEAQAEVLNVVPAEDKEDEILVALKETPCYAESGGQVADEATIQSEEFDGELVHCSKVGDVFVHRVRVRKGSLQPGAKVRVQVTAGSRVRTACNHTATHLMHEALKQILGDHVAQAGSLVAPDRLRFDFAHSGALTPEEVAQVEALVNDQIQRDATLDVNVMDRASADKAGAVALFGEKYGDEVRVVSVPGFSTELCGGTHVDRTGRIQGFKILGQSSVAANVRRVECLAGPALIDHLGIRARQVDAISAELNCPPDALDERVLGLVAEIKKLKKDLQAARKKGASLDPEALAKEAAAVPGKGYSLAAGFAEGLTVPDLRDLSDVVLTHLGKGVVLLATANEGKVNFVCKVDKDLLSDGVHAGKLVKEVSAITGGKGGGRPEMATGGGSDASKVPEALKRAHEVLASA